MESLLLNMGISFVLSAIDAAFKNSESRAKLRRVMTKLRDSLNLLYPPETFPLGSSHWSDEDFLEEMKPVASAELAAPQPAASPELAPEPAPQPVAPEPAPQPVAPRPQRPSNPRKRVRGR